MSKNIGGSSFEKMGSGSFREGKTQFELDEFILFKYPDLKNLSEKEKMTVSAIYSNLGTVESWLESIKLNKPAGGVEYSLELVGKALDEMKAINNSALNNFLKDYEEKLVDITARAKEIIGDKKRNTDIDSVYR